MRLTHEAIIAAALLAAAASRAGSQAPAAFAPSHVGPTHAPPPSVVASPIAATVDGQVSDMIVKGDSLEVVYVNTGRRPTDIIGAVQVRTVDDAPVHTLPLHAATVAAGATHRMRVAMPKLAKGRYTLYAIVDFGGAQLTAAQAALEIR